MIILNNSKSVKVFKAIGMPNLRIFPGHNNVDGNAIEKYFDNNPAAAGMRKDCLSAVDGGSLTTEEKRNAERSEKRNAELNKAQRIVKATNEKLAKSEDVIAAKDKQIEEQNIIIAELMKKVDKKK